MSIALDTPNTTKQQQRERLARDIERFMADGGTVKTEGTGYRPLAVGVGQHDYIKANSAAALLGFPEAAITQCFRTGILGGHPAPEYIKHRATSERMFLRESICLWVETYGKSGSKGMPKATENLMLTAGEVAQILGMSPASVSKYKTAGKLPPQVKGKDSRPYWRESDIREWNKERKRAAA